MVSTLGLNANNDLYLGPDGNLVMLTGQDAIEAACKTIAQAQLAEMIYATTQGLPNFQAVWIGVPNLKLWQSYLLAALQNVEGVEQVTDLSLSNIAGILTYEASITTSLDTTDISGSIPLGG